MKKFRQAVAWQPATAGLSRAAARLRTRETLAQQDPSLTHGGTHRSVAPPSFHPENS
jgi:hypothetical protein